jgi:hypothetical protein
MMELSRASVVDFYLLEPCSDFFFRLKLRSLDRDRLMAL